MIITKDGTTEVKAKTIEELFGDMVQVVSTFIIFSKKMGVPDEVIEKTMMQMVVDGFNANEKDLYDLSGEEFGED